MTYRGKKNILGCLVSLVLFMGYLLGIGEGNILLHDDFWNLTLSNRAGGVYSPIWEAVEYPLLIPEDDGVGNIVLKPGQISMRTGDKSWDNYQYEVKFRLDPAKGDKLNKLVLGVRCDDANPTGVYKVVLEHDEDGFFGRIVRDDEALANYVLGGSPLETLGSSWHTFSAKVIGDSLTAYLDDIELYSILAPQMAPQGNIFFHWSNSSGDNEVIGQIASIKVTEIKIPLSEGVINIDKDYMRNLWYLETMGNNLALRKKCILSPEPNYNLTKSESDPWDLTDGKLACQVRRDDRIWWDKHAVGWRSGPFIYVTIDLEEEKSIDRVVIRTLGGREQSTLIFPKKIQVLLSADGVNYYNIAEWQKTVSGDDSKFVYLPEEGRHYVYPLSFECDNRSARYVVLKIEPAAFTFMDEVAVIEGSYPPIPVNEGVERVPFKHDSAILWSEVNALYVCNNMHIYDRVILTDLRNNPGPVELFFELPKGVELIQAYRESNKGLAFTRREINRDSKPYNQYEIFLKDPNPYEALEIWLTTTWNDGEEGQAYLYAQWPGGQQENIPTPVYAYSIAEIESPRRLHTSIAWMGERFQQRWPDFFKDYKALGFNAVPFFPRYGLYLDWAEQARELGFDILYNESPMHVMANTFKNEEEIYILCWDGRRGEQVSLAYRGRYYQHEIERVEHLSKALKPEWVFFDLELFSGYAPIAGKDQQLLQRLEAEQRRSVAEACIHLGKELLTDLTNAAKKWAGNNNKPIVGFYSIHPERPYHRIFDFTLVYPNTVDLAQPSQYYRGDAAMVGNQIRNIREMLPESDIIPWLTAGTYGEFPSQNLRDMVLEAFFNGSRGITFYQYKDFNCLDLKYTSEAIAIASEVEDIIMDGQLIGYGKLTSDNPNTRMTGLEKQSGEAAILISNYVDKDEIAVNVHYKVTSPSHIIDLDDGTLLGIITPEKGDFLVKLSPRVRSKAFVVRPLK